MKSGKIKKIATETEFFHFLDHFKTNSGNFSAFAKCKHRRDREKKNKHD